MNPDKNTKHTTLFAFVVLSITIAGYFTGLQAPMVASTAGRSNPVELLKTNSPALLEVGVIPATPYANIAGATNQRSHQTRLASLKSAIDPLAEITIAPGEKPAALDQRKKNRAFNGSPPTIPHPIDQRSDKSCVACHGLTGLACKNEADVKRLPGNFIDLLDVEILAHEPTHDRFHIHTDGYRL